MKSSKAIRALLVGAFCFLLPTQQLTCAPANSQHAFFETIKTKLRHLFSKRRAFQGKKLTLEALIHHTSQSNIKSAYEQFLKTLQAPGNEIVAQSFAPLLEKLRQLNLSQYWLENSFVSAWQQTNNNAKLTAILLLQEFALSKDFLDELAYKHHRLSLITQAKLAHKKSALKQWRSFKKHILSFFLEAEVSTGQKEAGLLIGHYDFKTTFNDARSLGRLAAITTMLKVIKKFDNFSAAPQHIPIKTLLTEYRSLFDHWNSPNQPTANTSPTQATFPSLRKQFAILLAKLTRRQGFSLRTRHKL
ncbi:hypothetical protein KAU11_01330 [Candidatus Babeliales bacterium]|nr:hypothetical protein [Candidatus Babeliales bacterium]